MVPKNPAVFPSTVPGKVNEYATGVSISILAVSISN
jgi:hypothetical protein